MSKGSMYVKPIRTTRVPSLLLCLTVEQVPIRRSRSRATEYTTGNGVWSLYSRRAGHEWHGSDTARRLPLPELWNYLDSLTSRRNRLYVVCPIASDLLTLTGFWDQCDSGRYRIYDEPTCNNGPHERGQKGKKQWLGQLCLKGKPDIVSVKGPRGGIVFVSQVNFGDIALPDTGGSPGTTDTSSISGQGTASRRVTTPKDECERISRYMRGLLGSWSSAGNGTWRHTIGGLAQSLWRSRFYHEKVCRHADEDAVELESGAMHGGRASAWFSGDVGWRLSITGPVQHPPLPAVYPTLESQTHRLDVRSMYPALLRDMQFPVRLLSVLHDVSPADLKGLLRHWGIIASVSLRSDMPEYPLRQGDRVLFPVGEYDTVLCGPELELAAAEGAVRRVYRVARYEMGEPFAEFAGFLIGERERLRAAGDYVGESFIKQLSNSFGGKFAQRSDRWIPRPGVYAPVRWGRYLSRNIVTGEIKQYRCTAGLPFLKQSGRPGERLLAAVFGYLTAYGRVQMRKYRDTCGPNAVLAQDTDGLWVTDDGFSRLQKAGSLSGDTAGKLRHCSSHTFSRFYDATHYYVDGWWTLSGFKNGFSPVGADMFTVSETCNPVRAACGKAPRAIATITRCVPLRVPAPLGGIDDSGWSRPPRLSYSFQPPRQWGG